MEGGRVERDAIPDQLGPSLVNSFTLGEPARRIRALHFGSKRTTKALRQAQIVEESGHGENLSVMRSLPSVRDTHGE